MSKVFGAAISKEHFSKITEDIYYTYGVSQVLHKLSVEESALWIKNFIGDTIFFNKKVDLRNYIIKYFQNSELLLDNNLFLEFGVASGTSINSFAKGLQTNFFGFDTFEGMPEDWKGWNVKQGQFSSNGLLPKVEQNVRLIKGLIENTLPTFLQAHAVKKIAFIHIDTDTYAPAKTILQLCKKFFFPGTLILFDELHSYTSWKLHEYKALMEELPIDSYNFIAFSEYKQGLIKIIKAND